MNDRIAASLGRLFETHRIVVWTDPAREMREAFDGLDLPGVTKLRIANNEFGLKRRILLLAGLGRDARTRDGIDILTVPTFLAELAAGTLFAPAA